MTVLEFVGGQRVLAAAQRDSDLQMERNGNRGWRHSTLPYFMSRLHPQQHPPPPHHHQNHALRSKRVILFSA